MGCSFDELEPDPFEDPGPILFWENSNKVKCKFVVCILDIYSLLVSNYIIYIEMNVPEFFQDVDYKERIIEYLIITCQFIPPEKARKGGLQISIYRK